MPDRADISQILIDYAPKQEAAPMAQLENAGEHDDALLDRLAGLPIDPGARHGVLMSWVSDALLLNMDEIAIYEKAKEWMAERRGDEELASEEVKRMISSRKELLAANDLKPSEWVARVIGSFDESEFDEVPAESVSEKVERPSFGGILLRSYEDRLRDRWLPRSMLIQGILPADGVGALIAMPGVGKSLTATEIARCVAGGVEFAGQPTMKGRVIYACPDSPASTERRTLAMTAEENKNILTVTDFPSMPGSIKHLKKLLKYENEKAQEEGGLPIRLLIVDTWDASRKHTDGGYSGQDGLVEEIAGGLRKLAEECKVGVLITHHATRADNARARGSVVFDARLDIWILVEASGNNSLRLDMRKNRDGEKGPCGFFYIKGVDVNGQSMPRLEWGGNDAPKEEVSEDGITEDALEAFCRGCERTPTLKEICARFQVSPKTVVGLANNLRERGIMGRGSYKIEDGQEL